MRGPWEQDRPAAPHKVLDAYVHTLTTFTPLDGDQSIMETEPDIGPLEIEDFPWDKISQGKSECFVRRHLLIFLLDPKLLDDLTSAIHSFVTRGDLPKWQSDREPLVEYGIARFTEEPLISSQRRESARVAVEEPLALVSIMRYFESGGRTHYSNMAIRSKDNRGIVFEEAVLLAMTRLLQGKRMLGDILEFHGPLPSWAGYPGQIVARSSSGSFEAFAIDGPINPGSTFPFSAKTPEDVASWLERGEAGWCIPSRQMGPDMMTRVRLWDGRILLLVVQAKCHSKSKPSAHNVMAAVTAEAIRSVTPNNFFRPLVRNPLISSCFSLNFVCL
jgi:hypothetical protein